MRKKAIFKKAFLIVLTVVIVVNQLAFSSFAVVFTDTTSHWGKNAIDTVTDLGIMTYSGTTNFYPNNYYARKDVAYSLCMFFKRIIYQAHRIRLQMFLHQVHIQNT